MYEDDRRLFEYKKMDEHISGGASPGYWLLTQDAIYVGNYDGLLVLDWNGTVLTQSDQYIYAFDVYENQVYMRTKDDYLACADVQTLANAAVIRYHLMRKVSVHMKQLGTLFISHMMYCGATISVNWMQVIV